MVIYTWGSIILTNGVKAVDIKACGVSAAYVDLLQVVVRAVGQHELYGHHAGLVQTRLPGEVVFSWETFSCHMVQQLIGFHESKSGSGDLEEIEKTEINSNVFGVYIYLNTKSRCREDNKNNTGTLEFSIPTQ